MAARRLIIVMLILLGISTLLAAALPDRVRDAEEENTASETSQEAKGATEKALTTRRLKPETINADERQVVVITLQAGQELPLTVKSSTDDLVEIQGIGFVDAVGPYKPATFDILTGNPGPYGIRLVNAKRTIGRLEVKPASAAKPAQGAK
jgi:hypothetical protein